MSKSSLIVEVLHANDVPRDRLKKNDPYIVVFFKGIKQRTSHKNSEINPIWNEVFQKLEFDFKKEKLNAKDCLEIQLKDHETIGSNKILGKGVVPLAQLLKRECESLKCQVEFYDLLMSKLESVKLFLNIEYKGPREITYQVNGEMIEKVNSQVMVTSGIEQDDKYKGNIIQYNNNIQRLKKVQDFQIRIKVIEGRQLDGNNIHPLCCIKCSVHTKYTKTMRSTINPYWNEMFFFNFHSTPTELFDEFIEFKVFNSLKIRQDSLIGCFKIDIGSIYDEPNHSLNRKWLLLSDTGDQVTNAKGYLKVSINILGPGDEITSNTDQSDQDQDDIESNLLKPPGVMLRPATLILKLYRGEDLPRMDTKFLEKIKDIFKSHESRKDLVDPFAIFSFGGQAVKSKVIYNDANPEWNQELKIGLKFPSLCDKIKISLKDWDRASKDDMISTLFLNLQDISDCSENGYLPSFGPCFLNLYGGPREYSELPTKFDDLNHGKGEGGAYRGRILFELKTILGELPNEQVSDINHTDIALVDLFLRRKKYKLYALFLDATMITDVDKPIEFEVSIGNYGNKLDEETPSSSSTTTPTNPVFDGSSYYFLPWGEIKPYIQITSQWEDISFRLEASNQINNLRHYISSCVDWIKKRTEKFDFLADKNSVEIQEFGSKILKMIESIKCLAKHPLVEPIQNQHQANDLDRLLYTARVKYINELIEKCNELPGKPLKQILDELEYFCDMLEKYEKEPQNSIPDIIIWMLCGNERIAFYRIPAKDVFYSANSESRGHLCGQLQTILLKWPGKDVEDKEKKEKIPAQLRVKFWFGFEKDEKVWLKHYNNENVNGAITIFAETYENQVYQITSRSWTKENLNRPNFSDVTGKVELLKEKFELQKGWEWTSKWEVAQEISLLFDKDAGHSNYMEEVYEQHSRLLPGATWSFGNEDKIPFLWADFKGEKSKSKELFELRVNWKWVDDWNVDINRAVDNEGWEYCIDPSMGGWCPSEKMYHLIKRRRWIRNRVIVLSKEEISSSSQVPTISNLALLMAPDSKKQELEETIKDGWEYAREFSSKFHAKEKSLDMVRRRRWHRQMRTTNENVDLAAIFRFNKLEQNNNNEQTIKLNAPRMFIKFKKPHQFQLRCYIYQARSLFAGDSDTSLSDPYCKISFMNRSGKTEVIKRTIAPTWDQTIIFESVSIYSSLQEIIIDPPKVFIQVFDHDPYGRADFLGQCIVTPKVKGNNEDTILEWYQIKRYGSNSGEILAAFDLYHLNDENKNANLPVRPPISGSIYRVPNDVKPVLQRSIIEVLCWGIRNMKNFQLSEVDCPQVVFECGGHKIESEVLKHAKKNLNFQKPALYFDIMLPKEEQYTPPITIKVLDHRNFGRKPVVGVHEIKSLTKYRVDRNKKEFILTRSASMRRNGEYTIELEVEPEKKSKTVVEEDIDWWSKFYASIGDYNRCGNYLSKQYEKLTVFMEELENQKKFEQFTDFCDTFHLKRGKTPEVEENEIVGEFKGMFKVYAVEDNKLDIQKSLIYGNLQTLENKEFLVRVYIVRGLDLQPKDSNGRSDPYVQIINGKTKLDSRDEYIPNSNNPEFGKMFEFKTTLPQQKDLCIRVKDYDLISLDDVIGETWIDLENRYLTKYRATVGLPRIYNVSGPNQWRDSLKPSEILAEICKERKFSYVSPKANNLELSINEQIFRLNDYENESNENPYTGSKEERLCLYVLQEYMKLVPEHVETRKLYNSIQPNIEQGKLQMWIDLYPLSLGPPGPAFDIKQRKPKQYSLRCIIWNTREVPFDDLSITGEKMSDIYVKGWLQGIESDKQRTDVHYRSMDGDGYFNWRFVFDFNYLPAEQTVILQKKEHFWSLDETKSKVPPLLNLQIWDNDKFSADDFIGQISLNLNNMVKPVTDSDKCGLNQLEDISFNSLKRDDKEAKISLFEQRRMKGWLPCFAFNEKTNKREIAGKIELELELLTEEESMQRPAGRGREAPNENPKLDEPKRPDASFLWFASPLRTFKFIVWRRYKCTFFLTLLLILLVFLILIMIYTMPRHMEQSNILIFDKTASNGTSFG